MSARAIKIILLTRALKHFNRFQLILITPESRPFVARETTLETNLALLAPAEFALDN